MNAKLPLTFLPPPPAIALLMALIPFGAATHAPAATFTNAIGTATGTGSGLGWDQFLAARFAFSTSVKSLSVAGEFYSISGSFFAALVPLDSMSDLPTGNPAQGVPFNPGEVLAYQTFSASVGSTPQIITVPFTNDLPAGVYGVVFGTGLYGTSGSGAMPRYNAVSGSSGFFWSSSPWRWQNGSTQEKIMITVELFSNIGAGLPGVEMSSVAWGDYDNDGRLDLLLTGDLDESHLAAQVWRNTGSGFTHVPIPGLRGVQYGCVAWCDYDNDGRLDFMLTGQTNYSDDSGIAQVWRNTGSGFTHVPIPGMPGVNSYSRSVAWGDYDNDGREDILLTGEDRTSTPITQLWRNTGSGFTNVPIAGVPGARQGSVAWGDYDNDGWLDFLLTGRLASGGAISQLWRNTGSGFTNVAVPGLPPVRTSSVAWGDYDNDGYLDILLTGYTGSGLVSQVWRNTGSGFTNVPIPGLPTVWGGSVAWGDYDNDGRLDILLTGTPDPGADYAIAQVWRNTTSGFTNLNLDLPGTCYSSAAWGDYDKDGRLDIVLAGWSPSGRIAQVWRNLGSAPNASPTTPTGLTNTVSGRDYILEWNPATDGQTPAAGLTYNLRVGTSSGASDIVSPQAAPTTGFRRLPAMGNVQQGLSARLANLPEGDYYWSVQAVDTAFAGSDFAAEAHFAVYPPEVETLAATDVTATGATLHATVDPINHATLAWFEYGLSTKYGSATSPTNMGQGADPVPTSSPVSGLLPWLTYHYRVVGSNAVGQSLGPDMTLTLPGPSASAPTLSTLTDIILPQAGSTSVVFSVSPADVGVQVQCNNTVLLPTGGLFLGGSGAVRSLNLVPDPSHSGVAQITVTASDGTHAATRTFSLTVVPWDTDPSRMLYLTDAHTVSAEAWRFRLADFGTASTNYAVQYRSVWSPTNGWVLATNVTDLGGGLYEVDTGPPQPDTGFYRVKGFRLLTAGLDLAGATVDEGASQMGAVIVFNGAFVGTVNYTWTGAWGTTNGTVQVNGSTAVIPVPVADNTGIDPLRSLTLRLEAGTGFALGGTTESTITVAENDVDWQGTLVVPDGLADTTTALLTNRLGGYTNVALPQNTSTVLGFTLQMLQSNGALQGHIRSEGCGFFPTNVLTQLTLTENSFIAVATNIPLPSLTGSPLFSAPHRLDLRLEAANAPGQTNVSPTQISGVATLVSLVPGRSHLDTALSGTFLLLKPPVIPSTNEVPLYSAP